MQAAALRPVPVTLVHAACAMWRGHPAGRSALPADVGLTPVARDERCVVCDAQMEDENTLSDIWQDLTSMRFATFYNVPKVKFALHFASHIAFMAMLTILLLVKYDDTYMTIDEFIFWGWTATRAVGEINEIDSFDYKGLRAYGRDVWNQMDMLTSGLVVATAIVRFISTGGTFIIVDEVTATDSTGGDSALVLNPSQTAFEQAPLLAATARNMYAFLVILVYLRVLQYMRYFKSLGLISIVISGIVDDVGTFAVIQLTLALAFGVAFAVLQPGPMAAYATYNVLSPMFISFWALFGDFSKETAVLQVNDEQPTAILMPLLLWIYLFVATIILVNLLIAQLSDTFVRITGEGLQRWQFERCLLVNEFKETKPPLPPPFNVLWLLGVTWPSRLLRGEASVGGFKTLPSARILAQLQQQETDALQRCLMQRAARTAESVEARCDLSVSEIRKLEQQNRSHFENLNGRMDKIDERLSRLDKTAK